MTYLKFTINIGMFFFLSCLMTSCQEINQNGKPRKPEANRFTKVVLADDLDEPMQFEILKDGRVLIVERKGKIKVFDPVTKELNVIADIPVSTGYYSKTGEELSSSGEDGMQGVVIDPDFDQNHWIYLYYSPKGENSGSILTRYEWRGDTLNLDSKKVLLQVPNQRQSCCHLGGGMVFDAEGNLYLSTGDNTPNDPKGYSPRDEQPGRSRYDAQRTSSNTNDLRGKILRIHPEPNGSYSIPEGNLFPKGTPKARPEIYTMGNRNPWRLSIDSATGWLYWGEVGPGGTTDSIGLGPRTYDEFNQARKAGNYGWPYFIADNKSYWEYDYAADKSGKKFNPAHPINDSPNNTGLNSLPPAQPAFIWYPQSKAIDFPLLGSGSNSAVGGPIYHQSNFQNPKRPFPQYYENKWFITDWTRGWIMVVSFDEKGGFESMEQFLPKMEMVGPLEMEFGPEGDLYILEYGRGPYKFNPEAQLVRIEYNSGNRKPIVAVTPEKRAGTIPLKVHLSSAGTKDYDNDQLTYEWLITSKNKPTRVFTEANPMVIFDEPGTYQAVLRVSDSKGATSKSKIIEIISGNEPPKIEFDFNGANKSFFFPGDTINYSVQVRDKEDGSLANGEISPSEIAVNIDYLPADNNFSDLQENLKDVDVLVPVHSISARRLISQSDCRSCHRVDKRLIGPAYQEISMKYEGVENTKEYLVEKIITGGSGNWEAELAMPPHPEMTKNEASTIAKYILDLKKSGNIVKSFPVKGTYITEIPESERNKVSSFFDPLYTDKFIFRSSYTDHGTEVAPPQSMLNIVVLQNPIMNVSQADKFEGVELNHQINITTSTIVPQSVDSYIGLNHIDLTGINLIEFTGSAISGAKSSSAGIIEIRINSPTGKLVGQTPNIVLNENKEKASLAKAAIDKVSGVHDVYFVFTTGKDGGVPSQMQIKNIKFINQ